MNTVVCEKCGWTGTSDAAISFGQAPQSVLNRLEPGTLIPAGWCPTCRFADDVRWWPVYMERRGPDVATWNIGEGKPPHPRHVNIDDLPALAEDQHYYLIVHRAPGYHYIQRGMTPALALLAHLRKRGYGHDEIGTDNGTGLWLNGERALVLPDAVDVYRMEDGWL